jgi:hypothetical protein
MRKVIGLLLLALLTGCATYKGEVVEECHSNIEFPSYHVAVGRHCVVRVNVTGPDSELRWVDTTSGLFEVVSVNKRECVIRGLKPGKTTISSVAVDKYKNVSAMDYAVIFVYVGEDRR